MRRIAWWLGGLVLVLLVLVRRALRTCGESDRGVGVVKAPARDAGEVAQRAGTQRAAATALAPGSPSRSILFGDLHVHTTFSIDAFLQGLPIFGGEGAHPPADACDYARHCAQLDFFSLNDHAESLWPARGHESGARARGSTGRAGDPASPDLVAYAGYEWTQVGLTPDAHYGHKNVVFRGIGEGEVAARPIDSLPSNVNERAQGMEAVERLAGIDSLGMYSDFFFTIHKLGTKTPCEEGVDTRELPDDCRENATTPRALFEKLAQSGLDTIVIPHGLA